MYVAELFQRCLDSCFRRETQETFFRDIIRDLGGDIGALNDKDATELSLVIIARLGEKLLNEPMKPHPLNYTAFNLLLSWYFPTDDQMLAALYDMKGISLESRRLNFEGERNAFARNMLIVSKDSVDTFGTHWPQGSLISTVRGPYRLDYLKLISAAAKTVEQDSMRDIPVLGG